MHFLKVILDILGLTHQYGFIELESAISEYLKEIHNVKNVCTIFDAARLYQLESLMKVVIVYI
jgi:BTB/POZ domain-containing protein 9